MKIHKIKSKFVMSSDVTNFIAVCNSTIYNYNLIPSYKFTGKCKKCFKVRS